MKWAFYNSLKEGAKKALKRGNGRYRKYAVDGRYIAIIDENGRPKDWVFVAKGGGPTITAKEGK